jgi:hypothetical protein
MAAGDGRFGRRGFLKGATAVTLGSIAARGVYEVLDEAGGGPARAWAAAAVRRLQEQYLVDRIEVILDNGVTVAIPPLHNDVFTAKLNPFFWSPETGFVTANAPGMHFVAFLPASRLFRRARRAMDGVMPDGTNFREAPYSISDEHNGRQNYLIPPRRHRSFPLMELLI